MKTLLNADIEGIAKNLLANLERDDLEHILLDMIGSDLILKKLHEVEIYQERLKNATRILNTSTGNLDRVYKLPCYQCKNILEYLQGVLTAYCTDSTEVFNIVDREVKG